MNKTIVFSVIFLLIVSICSVSCSRKGYYPKRKTRPKKDCGCGGMGYKDINNRANETFYLS